MESKQPNEIKEIHNPGLVLILTVAVAVLFQIAIYHWQKRHKRSFLMVSLVGLWLIPIAIAVFLKNYLFSITWCIYFTLNAWMLKMALKKPVQPSTPRTVYGFYHKVFQLTLVGGLCGYVTFLVNTFAILSAFLFEYSITAIFYAVYFGVLSRDMIDLASDMMASNLGYYNQKGFPSKHLRPNICAVCGGSVALSEPKPGAEPTANSNLMNINEPIITLDCQHSFHDYCLRGWCLIGKKDMCPYCKEKVDLRLFKANPWQDPEFIYGRFLDFVRYLIVWQPILLSLINITFYLTGN